jgi:hypothetical protein
MSLTFLVAACVFVAVVGVLVAWIDRWRESRLTVARPLPRAGRPVKPLPGVSSTRKRAA